MKKSLGFISLLLLSLTLSCGAGGSSGTSSSGSSSGSGSSGPPPSSLRSLDCNGRSPNIEGTVTLRTTVPGAYIEMSLGLGTPAVGQASINSNNRYCITYPVSQPTGIFLTVVTGNPNVGAGAAFTLNPGEDKIINLGG